MNKQTLIEEIKYSLLSKRMLEAVNCGAIKVNGEIIYLKNRYDHLPQEETLIKYGEQHDINHDYKEILGKSVLFDLRLIGTRGIKAIEEWINIDFK